MNPTMISRMRIQFALRLCAVALCAATMTVAAAEPMQGWNGTAAAPATAALATHDESSLAGILDDSGYLALASDFAGTVDTSGFELISGAGEAPRFRATKHRGARGDADDRWADGFGLGNGCDGPVHAMVNGGSGEVYLGGSFGLCGDALAHNVVRYDPIGDTWSALGSGDGNGVNGIVRALAFADGNLYVGGSFSQANTGDPITANHLARWDGSAWTTLGSSGGNGVNAAVYALAVSGSSIYVGGDFTFANVDGPLVTANRIVRWTGAAWSVVGSGGGNGTNFTVLSLAVLAGNVYVGGDFSQVNFGPSIAANRIAVWNGASWGTLGSGGGNGVNHSVTAIAVVGGGNVFVGGNFNQVNVGPSPVSASRIAHWNGAAWSALGSGGGNGISGQVYALRVIAGNLYAGGNFNQVNVGAAVTAHRLARWNGSTWLSVGTGGGEGVDGIVRAMTVVDDELYVGGDFTHRNLGAAAGANRALRWTGIDWDELGSAGNGVPISITAMAVLDGNVYVGGEFTQVGGISANYLARWDGSTWSTVGSAGGNGADASIFALTVSGSDLYAGGNFTQVNVGAPIAANRVARWNGSTWSALGSGGGNGVNMAVHALAVSGGDLFVAGTFSQANIGAAITANRIARWNGSVWSALGSGGGNGLDSFAYTLAVFGGDLFVGGLFTQANFGAPIPANRIARWDGSTWSAVGSGGGNGMSGTVIVLAASGGHLYAGGNFTSANVGAPVSVNRLARWDGSHWSGIGSGDGIGVNGSVRSLVIDGELLYVAGDFTQVNVGAPIAAERIALWNGAAWSTLGSGIGAQSVFAMVRPDVGSLYAGGIFRSAGGKPAANFSRYSLLAELLVEFSGLGTGQVVSTPPGIDCPGTCSAVFAAGTPLALEASADSDARALGWFGIDCPGSGPCSFDLNDDRTVTAGFGVSEGRSLRYYGNGSGAPTLDRVTVALQDPPRPANIGTGDFTLELWLRAADGNDSTASCVDVNDAWIEGNIVVDRDTFGDGDHGDFGLSLMAGRLAFGISQGALGTTVCGSTSISDGAWHHVAVTRNATTGLTELWLDGALEHSEIGPVGDVSYRTDRPTAWPWDAFLVFGAEKHDAGPTYPSFSGWIDEVRLSSVRRYNAPFTPEETLPIDAQTEAMYRFDAGAGTVIFDEAVQIGGSSHGQLRHGGTPAGPCWSKDSPALQRIFAHGFQPEGCLSP